MVKKNNPFKMWGSWVGAILGLVIMTYFMTHRFFDLDLLLFKEIGFGVLRSIYIYISTIIGFLAGWGIHSLIRKLRK